MKRFVAGWTVMAVMAILSTGGTSWAACLSGETEGEVVGRLRYVPEHKEMEGTEYLLDVAGDQVWVVYPVGAFFGTPGVAGPVNGPEIDAKLRPLAGRDVRIKGCLGEDDMIGGPAISEISGVEPV